MSIQLKSDDIVKLRTFFQPTKGSAVSDFQFNEIISLINESLLMVSELELFLSSAKNDTIRYNITQGDLTKNTDNSYNINLPEVAAIASDLGLGTGGGLALAAMNDQSLASTIVNMPAINVATGAGTPQTNTFDAQPVAETGVDQYGCTYAVSVATEAFTLTVGTGGILNLDTLTYTPLTVTGGEDGTEICVTDNAGDLLDILYFDPQSGTTQYTMTRTVAANPAEKDSGGNTIAASNVTGIQLDPANGGYASSGEYTTSTGAFAPPPGGAILPFFAEAA